MCSDRIGFIHLNGCSMSHLRLDKIRSDWKVASGKNDQFFQQKALQTFKPTAPAFGIGSIENVSGTIGSCLVRKLMPMISLIWQTQGQQTGWFWNVRSFTLEYPRQAKNSIADVIVEDQWLVSHFLMLYVPRLTARKSKILHSTDSTDLFINVPYDESVEATANWW